MPDEVAVAIVTALAVKAAELTADGLTGALRRLFRLIRDRFGAGTPQATVLADTMQRPDDGDRRAELAEALTTLMSADPEFADRVRAAWRDTTVAHGGVVNQFSGRADNVVQARDIGGDVRFGQ